MGGIFLGFLCALALLFALGRLRASQPPAGVLGAACWVLIALTGLDGLNAFLFDGNLPHLYPPSTALRLFTGLGAGLGVGLMAIPVVSSVVWSKTTDEDALEDPVELFAGLVLCGLLGGLVLVGVSVLLWPIAVAMLVSVLVAFGEANLYVLVLTTRKQHQAETPAELRGVLLASLGLALVELAGLSALRTFLIGSFGFSWGV